MPLDFKERFKPKSVLINSPILPKGVWHLIDVRPYPEREHLHEIISDINSDRCVVVSYNGKLKHYKECKSEHDDLPKCFKAIEPLLQPMSFKVAVREKYYRGYPVAVVIEPEISYCTFSDHPHISTFIDIGTYRSASTQDAPPFSLCLAEDQGTFGLDLNERMTNIMEETSVWLFRHQLWEASRKFGKGIWIGPQKNAEANHQFIYSRNPNGLCHCGRKRLYKDCHLQVDFNNYKSINPQLHSFLKKRDSDLIDLDRYLYLWEARIRSVNNAKLEVLKSFLL